LRATVYSRKICGFSRALLLFGAVNLPVILLFIRWRWDKGRGWSGKRQTRRLFISGPKELVAIKELISEHEPQPVDVAETVQVLHPANRADSDGKGQMEGMKYLGGLTDLNEVIRINRINEVILSGRELTASQKISAMTGVADAAISIFSIAWTEGWQCRWCWRSRVGLHFRLAKSDSVAASQA
jgi:hypothetical protein